MELSKVGKTALGSKGGSPGNRANDNSVKGEKMDPVEITILIIVIIVVWGLLLIPIIFYYLPLPQENEKDNETDFDLINVTDGIFACRENFFHEPISNICVPHCPEWRQEPKAQSITVDVVVFLSYFTGFVASIVILIISTIRHKTMFAYPNSLVVYMSIVYVFQNFFYIATFFDRAKLYCSSENLVATFSQVTPFCVISGIVQVYSTLSLGLWWFMLTATLFWKIWFPLNARSFQVTRKMKYFHVGCCLLGILIPVIPVIAHITSFAIQVKSSGSTSNFLSGGIGFAFVHFPPLPCNGGNTAIIFYSNILPTDLLLATSITLTILILWLVHKKYGLLKEIKSKNPFKIGSSERKLLIILCYYIVSTVINLTAFSEFSHKSAISKKRLASYFFCEQFGHDPNNPCNLENTVSVAFTILAYGFHGILPLVNLIFAINIEEIKTIYRQRFKLKIISSSSKRIPITSVQSKENPHQKK